MKTIFDIGMYDGTDTAYYLSSGYQVVAVEANPELIRCAAKKFSAQIASKQLVCVNAAISPDGQPIELHLCGHDLGSSSVFNDRVAHLNPIGAVTVPGVTLQQLIKQYGLPKYLKVDIEGADRLCVLALTADCHPPFLSFEMGVDVEELIKHAMAVGYRRFKIINQNAFRELENQHCLHDKLVRFIWQLAGYGGQRYVRRAGRFFLTGHSAGPVPWCSDGRWWSAEEVLLRLHKAKETETLSGWYDIHATINEV